MIKITGDFEAKLSRWSELLRDAEVIVEHTAEAQAEVALTLIGEGFEHEEDPYGKGWAKKQTDDGRKILHGETSRLRNGWHSKSNGKSWSVEPSVEYAAYHQAPRGGSRPTRMMVPSAAKGMPRAWSQEMKAVAAVAVIEHFKEAADASAPHHVKRTRNTSAASSGSSKLKGGPVKAGKRRGGVRSVGGLIRRLKQIRSLARKAGID